MANEAEQALYEKLAAVPTFHPSTASLLPDDWTLEPGDVVTVQSDGQDYLTPVYSMSLDWNGASKVSIQSTGNKKRAPLSAFQRRSFSSGRSGYKTQKDLDEAKVQYDRHFTATDKIVTSTMTAVGVKLNPDGTPMVDPETGDYVFDDQGATLASKVTATAGELATEVSTRTQQGISFDSRISQTAISISQVVTAIGKDGQVTAASIVTAINTDDTIGPTSSIRLSADKINLTGYVTATSLDTRMANVDLLFVQQGYGGTIYANGMSAATGTINDLTVGTLRMTTSGQSSDTISRKGVKIAGALQSNITVLGTGTDATLDVPNAIATIVADDNPPTGKIGFKYTTLASSTPVAVNFNIADTAFYQNSVGIASTGSWVWDSNESDYVRSITPNVGQAQTITIPSITVDANLGTNSSFAAYAYGPADGGGTVHSVSIAKTFYLKSSGSDVYVTNEDATPSESTNVVAKIAAGGSEYTSYIVSRSWDNYTPGTTYSTRKMTIKARGRKTDGTWVDLASSSFYVTGSYQTAETGGHELVISSYNA